MFWLHEDKVKVAGGLLQVLPNAKKKSRALENASKNACYLHTFESEDHIEALLAAIYGDELSNASLLKKNFASSATVAVSVSERFGQPAS